MFSSSFAFWSNLNFTLNWSFSASKELSSINTMPAFFKVSPDIKIVNSLSSFTKVSGLSGELSLLLSTPILDAVFFQSAASIIASGLPSTFLAESVSNTSKRTGFFLPQILFLLFLLLFSFPLPVNLLHLLQ